MKKFSLILLVAVTAGVFYAGPFGQTYGKEKSFRTKNQKISEKEIRFEKMTDLMKGKQLMSKREMKKFIPKGVILQAQKLQASKQKEESQEPTPYYATVGDLGLCFDWSTTTYGMQYEPPFLPVSSETWYDIDVLSLYLCDRFQGPLPREEDEELERLPHEVQIEYFYYPYEGAARRGTLMREATIRPIPGGGSTLYVLESDLNVNDVDPYTVELIRSNGNRARSWGEIWFVVTLDPNNELAEVNESNNGFIFNWVRWEDLDSGESAQGFAYWGYDF
ncbi:MAG: hypothetical protein HY466_03170 [Deltaproteobacteria bacterium]|nr:hypothetical protein [Deltaproteobacteria bacterium]